jgi:hypothetical protein
MDINLFLNISEPNVPIGADAANAPAIDDAFSVWKTPSLLGTVPIARLRVARHPEAQFMTVTADALPATRTGNPGGGEEKDEENYKHLGFLHNAVPLGVEFGIER